MIFLLWVRSSSLHKKKIPGVRWRLVQVVAAGSLVVSGQSLIGKRVAFMGTQTGTFAEFAVSARMFFEWRKDKGGEQRKWRQTDKQDLIIQMKRSRWLYTAQCILTICCWHTDYGGGLHAHPGARYKHANELDEKFHCFVTEMYPGVNSDSQLDWYPRIWIIFGRYVDIQLIWPWVHFDSGMQCSCNLLVARECPCCWWVCAHLRSPVSIWRVSWIQIGLQIVSQNWTSDYVEPLLLSALLWVSADRSNAQLLKLSICLVIDFQQHSEAWCS